MIRTSECLLYCVRLKGWGGVGGRGGGRGGRVEERSYVEEKEEDKGRMTGREDEGSEDEGRERK